MIPAIHKTEYLFYIVKGLIWFTLDSDRNLMWTGRLIMKKIKNNNGHRSLR